MEDKIYYKTKKGGVWENPGLGFACYLAIYSFVFFNSIFLFIFVGIPDFVLALWLIFLSIMVVTLSVLKNQSVNMSKSTAFIVRDGILYAIQLLYSNRMLESETSNEMIYAPSGTLLQASTLKNNIKVAQDVQSHEKEVRERRNKISSFSIALDDILDSININQKIYEVKSHNLLSHIENAGMCKIQTPSANYNFLILNNPIIKRVNKKYFIINFYNQNNELCSAKFTNCFDNLIDNINNKTM